MYKELLEYLLPRMAGPYLILELLMLALNRLPATPKEWEAKKEMMIRRFLFFLAQTIAAIWLLSL